MAAVPTETNGRSGGSQVNSGETDEGKEKGVIKSEPEERRCTVEPKMEAKEEDAQDGEAKPSVASDKAASEAVTDGGAGTVDQVEIAVPVELEQKPESRQNPGGVPASSNGIRETKDEPAEDSRCLVIDCEKRKTVSEDGEKGGGGDLGDMRRPSVEISSSDGEPLSRMDSEDSISSTLMEMESTVSSGRSTPAMMNGQSSASSSGTKMAYPCCWDLCPQCFNCSPDLAEHIRGIHVDGQRGGVTIDCVLRGQCLKCRDICFKKWIRIFKKDHTNYLAQEQAKEHEYSPSWKVNMKTLVSRQLLGDSTTQVLVFVCLWKGCKVYNTPSTSHSWLQRHMLTHSGDKPFKCVVGGCNASFASQGGLARHVPSHFSQQSSSKMSSQAKLKEESPSKAGLNKRKKLKNKRRCSLPRPHDFFDAQTMDAIRHRAICLNLATHIESVGNGHSVVFHSTVLARRKEGSGKVKLLLHWTPEDILPDAWVNETERSQLKTKVVHLSQLPHDTAMLLDPNIYRALPQKRLKHSL